MTQLKNLIDANIKNNGNQEITGNLLNYVLTEVANHTDKDWYESSETKSGYIYGRTHGVTSEFVKVEGTLTQLGYKSGEYVSVLHYPRVNGVLEGEHLYLNGLVYKPIIGQEYKVDYDGPNVYARIVAVEGGFDVQIKGSLDTGNVIKIAFVWIKTLDDAYISSNIARRSEVDALETKVDDKADITGIYPTMSVGKADDLSGHGESVAAEFTFRASGGKSIKDGTAYIKELQGNAVVYNQQLRNSTFLSPADWISERSEFSVEGGVAYIKATGGFSNLFQYVKPIQGHTYLILADAKGIEGHYLYLNFCSGADFPMGMMSSNFSVLSKIFICGEPRSETCQLYVPEDNAEWAVRGAILIDLTKMFQAGNEPTTIEEYTSRKPIVADEYAYNEGEVIAFNGDAIKSVGDNAWDEQWEQGGLDYGSGQEFDTTSYFRSKNHIKILPNTQYYFRKTAGAFLLPFYYDEDKNFIAADDVLFTNQAGNTFTTLNAAYMRFYCDRPTYDNDIMLTLVHSGWKVDTNAGYQPYWADTLQIDPRIREAFPQGMHKWDKVYNKDGKGYIVKGTGVVEDMGALSWTEGFGGIYSLDIMGNIQKLYQSLILSNLLCSRLATARVSSDDNGISIIYGGSVDYPYNGGIRVVGYDSVDSLLADIQGIPLYYELAEPTIEVYDTPFKMDYKVADFGTEELISEQPSAPFKARTIYQFNAVDQIRENAAEIEKIKAALAKAGITIDL